MLWILLISFSYNPIKNAVLKLMIPEVDFCDCDLQVMIYDRRVCYNLRWKKYKSNFENYNIWVRSRSLSIKKVCDTITRIDNTILPNANTKLADHNIKVAYKAMMYTLIELWYPWTNNFPLPLAAAKSKKWHIIYEVYAEKSLHGSVIEKLSNCD